MIEKRKKTFLSRLDTLVCSLAKIISFTFYYFLPFVVNRDVHITLIFRLSSWFLVNKDVYIL